jgi:excinuclease UvrABC helicase subunit UvrB
METFDELFDSFFNNDKKSKRRGAGRPRKEDSYDEKAKKIIESLQNFSEITDNEKKYEIDNELGEPHEVNLFKADGLFFKRSIWHTENGDLVKLEVSDVAFDEKKSLEELLSEALEDENYEKAAEIRDELKKLEKK